MKCHYCTFAQSKNTKGPRIYSQRSLSAIIIGSSCIKVQGWLKKKKEERIKEDARTLLNLKNNSDIYLTISSSICQFRSAYVPVCMHVTDFLVIWILRKVTIIITMIQYFVWQQNCSCSIIQLIHWLYIAAIHASSFQQQCKLIIACMKFCYLLHVYHRWSNTHNIWQSKNHPIKYKRHRNWLHRYIV